MAEYLTFKVSGEFITNIAREKFYIDHDLKSALEILESSLCTDQLKPNEIKMLALQIINKDARIKGTYPEPDYGIEFADDIDPDNCKFDTIIAELEKISDRYNTLQSEHNDLQRKFFFLCDQMYDFELRNANVDYYNEFGENLFEDMEIPAYLKIENQYVDEKTGMTGSEMLESYLAQKQRESENDDIQDYGWLSPSGEFYPAEWGTHAEWAKEWLTEHYPFSEHPEIYWKTDANGTKHHYVNGDCLVYCLHWVLIDSPYHGLANHHYDEAYGLTKAQKEFLYDYYLKRGQTQKANTIWKDDDV